MAENSNDFIDCFVDKINEIENLEIKAIADYVKEDESLGVYSLPGGSVVAGFMDGEKELSLNYEIAIKSKSQELASKTLWLIGETIGNIDFTVDSKNDSYEFEQITPEAPSLNDRDEDGWYLYILDFAARIITH